MDKISGLDPAMDILLQRAPVGELDYGFVMDCLSDYKAPRVKLNHLLKIGALIRVKKGLYVFGKTFPQHPYSLETLANKIYGPSYISLEWALQLYSLIPERVEVVTSMTTKRKRDFSTPLGHFSFSHASPKFYVVGITQRVLSPTRRYLVASKEKALADFLVIRRGKGRSLRSMEETLFEDMRIEEEDLFSLNLLHLQKIEVAYPHSAIHHLISIVKKGQDK